MIIDPDINIVFGLSYSWENIFNPYTKRISNQSDSSVPYNACAIKLAQVVLLWWGGVLVSTLVPGVVFLISLKHTEIVPGEKPEPVSSRSFSFSLYTLQFLFFFFFS